MVPHVWRNRMLRRDAPTDRTKCPHVKVKAVTEDGPDTRAFQPFCVYGDDQAAVVVWNGAPAPGNSVFRGFCCILRRPSGSATFRNSFGGDLLFLNCWIASSKPPGKRWAAAPSIWPAFHQQADQGAMMSSLPVINPVATYWQARAMLARCFCPVDNVRQGRPAKESISNSVTNWSIPG